MPRERDNPKPHRRTRDAGPPRVATDYWVDLFGDDLLSLSAEDRRAFGALLKELGHLLDPFDGPEQCRYALDFVLSRREPAEAKRLVAAGKRLRT